MRRVLTMILLAGTMAGVSVPALAQDQASGSEASGGEVQRVEVPEAGVAVSFPGEWDAYVEMREREDFGLYDEGLAEAPVPSWEVIYASAGGRPWCDLEWYPDFPLTMAEHAQRFEALMTPTSADVIRPVETDSVSLPAGEAYRFDIYNEPTNDYTTVYLLGNDGSRYLLQCVGDVRPDDDWLAVASSLELLDPTAQDIEED